MQTLQERIRPSADLRNHYSESYGGEGRTNPRAKSSKKAEKDERPLLSLSMEEEIQYHLDMKNTIV